jgi:hypothetical protein
MCLSLGVVDAGFFTSGCTTLPTRWVKMESSSVTIRDDSPMKTIAVAHRLHLSRFCFALLVIIGL